MQRKNLKMMTLERKHLIKDKYTKEKLEKRSIPKREHLRKNNSGEEKSEKGQFSTGKIKKDSSERKSDKYNSGKEQSEKGQFCTGQICTFTILNRNI